MVFISDLEYGCEALPLEVRVLRKWTCYYRKKEIWFLVVDEHGDAISILGDNEGRQFLESNFQLSKCYKVEMYSCSESSKQQRMIKNPIHLNVGAASNITLLQENDKIPKAWFNFVTTNMLYGFLDKSKYFPDFVGRFKKLYPGVKKNGEPILHLILTDNVGQELAITLWTECAENPERINKNLFSNATPDTLIAVTNVKPVTYLGQLRMHSTDGTHVIVNPIISEANTESQRMSALASSSVHAIPHLSLTLQELQNKAFSFLSKKTIAVDARVIDFTFDPSWYTMSCSKCRNRVEKKGLIWFCSNHGDINDPFLFYSVTLKLSDGTKDLIAMATDACVFKLIGRSCKDLVIVDGHDDRKTLPGCFDKGKMQMHRFYIELSKISTYQNLNYVAVDIASVPSELAIEETVTTTPEIVTTTPNAALSMTLSMSATEISPPPSAPGSVTSQKMPSPPSIIRKETHISASIRLSFDSEEHVTEFVEKSDETNIREIRKVQPLPTDCISIDSQLPTVQEVNVAPTSLTKVATSSKKVLLSTDTGGNKSDIPAAAEGAVTSAGKSEMTSTTRSIHSAPVTTAKRRSPPTDIKKKDADAFGGKRLRVDPEGDAATNKSKKSSN